MSTRDIEAALTDTLEVEGVSKSTLSTLCSQLKHDFERWQNRDLSDVDLLYLFCAGIYLRLRPEDPEAIAVSLMFAVLVDASAGWRGVNIMPAISRELDSLQIDSPAKPAVRLAA